jgi:hypothetical protein
VVRAPMIRSASVVSPRLKLEYWTAVESLKLVAWAIAST